MALKSNDYAAHDLTECEILSTRLFAVSRDVLFRACINPTLLAQWWGPAGFTNTFDEFDPTPGGMWKFVMHGPDGTDYYNESTFVEIVAPERLVLVHLRPMHRFQLAMTFADVNGETQLTWRMTFDSAEEVEKIRAFVPAANEQNFDRLQAVVMAMT